MKEDMPLSQKGIPFIRSREMDWETAGDGVERKILGYDDEVMMVIVRFKKGAIGTMHHHIHRQVTYVAAGSFEVNINGSVSVLQQGDSFFVAPSLAHGVVALEEGSLIDVFTPARQDFLLST